MRQPAYTVPSLDAHATGHQLKFGPAFLFKSRTPRYLRCRLHDENARRVPGIPDPAVRTSWNVAADDIPAIIGARPRT